MMSTETTDDRIIPETFLHSVFRNTTEHTLYAWWAGTHGMNIPAGEHFRILGDPRVPPRMMSAHGIVESIQAMLRDGKALTIRCGVDKQTRYTTVGAGLYKVLVTLTAVDGRTQDGVEVELIVEN